MANYTAYRLVFYGPIHLNKGLEENYGESLRVLHADTLKAALFSLYIQLFDVPKEPIEWHKKFRISSGFPYYEEKGEIEYFFPKPSLKLPFRIAGHEDKQAKESKKLKKISFLSKEFFEKCLAPTEQMTLNEKWIKEGFVSKRFEEKKDVMIYKEELRQQVSLLNRDEDGNPRPYYQSRIHFLNQSDSQVITGLYFLLECEDEILKEQLIKVLHLLADSGIGTDRNLGNGSFTFKSEEITLNLPVVANAVLNLSPFLPSEADIKEIISLPESAYQLLFRGGYISSSGNPDAIRWRKKSVYMFAESSVFNLINNNQRLPTGAVVDLQPDILKNQTINHSVWRDGQALFIPVNVN